MARQNILPFEMAELPGKQRPEEHELSLAEILAVLLRRKGFIASVTVLAPLAVLLAMHFQRPTFQAEATIMPPQQQQPSFYSIAAGTLGGLATSGMASQLGLKNPADLYIGILKSRTIAGDIVEKFHLKQVYGTDLMSQAERALSAHSRFSSGRDSLISIAVKDHDPRRAAEITNAYVDELYKQNSRLALTEAGQRRAFFEEQLRQEKGALANAEIALKETEQSTGLVVPNGQAEVLIRSGAQLRADIAASEVRLQVMRSYATDDNPQLQNTRRELAALRDELGHVEEGSSSHSRFSLSAERMPEASLQYIRALRDMKYHETLFEMLAKQFEASRIDEVKQAPIIQVIDRAVIPDKSTSLSTFVTFFASLTAGLFVSSLMVFLLRRFSPLTSRQEFSSLS